MITITSDPREIHYLLKRAMIAASGFYAIMLIIYISFTRFTWFNLVDKYAYYYGFSGIVYLILLIVTPVIGFTAICIVKRKILFFWFNVVNISSMVIIFGLSIYLGITVASSVYYIDYFGAYIFIFIFMFILPSGIVLFLTIRYSSYMDENTSDFSEFNTKKL